MPMSRGMARHKRTKTPPRTGTIPSTLAWILIPLATILAFAPAAQNAFVDWDDHQNITQNEHIRSFSIENLRWMATTAHMAVWQPLSWLVAALEYQLFGGPDEAALSRGMHITNIVLHAAASILCFLVIRRLIAGPDAPAAPHPGRSSVIGAALAALLFAVHPLRVELVAWATAQPYILALLFALTSLLCYLRYADGANRRWLIASYLAFALSLMSKSIAVPLAIVLLLLDWHPLGRLGAGAIRPATARRILAEKVPFLICAAAVTLIAPIAKHEGRSMLSSESHGPLQRCAQAAHGLVFYIWKTLIPTRLSPIYELEHPLDPARTRYLLSALILIAAALALLIVRKRLSPARFRTLRVAAASYVLLILPVLGFLQSGNQEVADRYAYLATIPLFVLLGVGLSNLWQRPRRRRWAIGAGLSLLGVAIVFSILSRRQCRVWHDTASLWTHAAALQPASSIAQNSYGYVLLTRGRRREAEDRFRAAISIRPTNDMAHYNLWRCLRERIGELEQTGSDAEALRSLRAGLLDAYRHGMRCLPNDATPYYHMGLTKFNARNYSEAVPLLRDALARNAGHARAHATLAGALLSLKDFDGAIRHARRAVELEPALGPARRNLARGLWQQGRRDKARRILRQGLEIDPADSKTQALLEMWADQNPS